MQKDFQMDPSDNMPTVQEVGILERIEETDPSQFWFLKRSNLDRLWSTLPTMEAEIDSQRPIFVYRYNGTENFPENNDINNTVLSLLENERDRRVEAGEDILPNEIKIQESLFNGPFVKNIKPKYDSLPSGRIHVLDYFLIEGGYNPKLLFNCLMAFHSMLTGNYGKYFSTRFPTYYLLTEKGYMRVSGFGWQKYSDILNIHLNTGRWSDRYAVSRLGIEKA